MSKTLHYSGTAQSVTPTDRDDILTAADGWHDPAAGRYVNHISYHFEAGTLSVSVRVEGLVPADVSAAINTLATQISGLPGDFGTVGEVEGDIRMD